MMDVGRRFVVHVQTTNVEKLLNEFPIGESNNRPTAEMWTKQKSRGTKLLFKKKEKWVERGGEMSVDLSEADSQSICARAE